MRFSNPWTIGYVAVLLLYVLTGAWGEELAGNANVDSATKIQAMNQSVNEDWNVNDQKGTRLLVLFDSGNSRIDSQYDGAFEIFADYMHAHAKSTADIFGHSDRMGGTPADFQLAQARANAVRQVLIDGYGIQGDRLKAVGYGQITESETNITASEKQLNRRVFAIIKDLSSKHPSGATP